MSDLSLLIDMGFPQSKAERALNVTGNNGVEPAMEWLLAHGDSLDSFSENNFPSPVNTGGVAQEGLAATVDPETKSVDEEKPSALNSSDNTTTSVDDTTTSADDTTTSVDDIEARSMKCDECGKKFRSNSEVEFHAAKTGHQSFSESSEEIKPLSEEEKKEQVKKIENIIKQRRAEKAEQEKKEALEREKSRRKTGQEITHIRQKMQEQEMKQLAEAKRREKLEEKMARQKILEEIERDKQARREKFSMGGAPATTSTPTPQPVQIVTEAAPVLEYDQCRLQIRLMNGECLVQTFGPGEQLAAVRLFVEMKQTEGNAGPFSFMTSFPRRVFSEEDMSAPLASLGLVPSAVLIVCKPQ